MLAQGDLVLHTRSLPRPQERSHPTGSTPRPCVLLLRCLPGSLRSKGDEPGIPQPHLLPGRTNKRGVRIRGEIFIHAAALCEPLGGCRPQPEQPPVTLDYLKGLGPLSMLAPLSRTSESSILPMQTRLPLTLSLTFCNHEILMTNIEFKVQFVSGSFGGKGSCTGIVLRGTWRAGVGVEGAGGEDVHSQAPPGSPAHAWPVRKVADCP